ncbi:hypothetical protein [Sedimentitalea nanhaiensis]|uniref:Outer membrane surface antigen n=1 Tax=Sedimentitalea nanhaiensis TaxID=999627 RepID=A0A1I7E7C6_9RHOB|nr:hypothetical protein [Sedimentitalea nanhaiensis]SFU19866.1 hypothetical protein SAMN05216236_14811 [Sedimentitalea nanhaiensis]
MKYVLTLLLALGAAASLPPAPEAQNLSKILAQSGLSPVDFDLMAAAEAALLGQNGPGKGQEKSWSNPKSESRGTVQAIAVQGNCAELLHLIHPKGQPKQVELRKKMCKSADGRWLLTL